MKKLVRAQIAPWGEFLTDHGIGAIEVFTREDVAAAIKNSRRRVPVFNGFPMAAHNLCRSDTRKHNVEILADRHRDNRVYGMAVRLLATDFGLEADIWLNGLGVSLCQQRKVSAADLGRFVCIGGRRFRFDRLTAIGLTENPSLEIKPIELHLWRCTDGREQPMPPVEFV